MDPYVGAVVSGRFRIERRLASGGMGRVYLARNVEMDQEVAVKLLHHRFAHDESYVTRFLNEAKSTGRVRHPQAVSIYDAGRLDDGTLFLVMEYVHGTSLASLLKARGALPALTAVRIGQQLCEVLASAHAAQVIHRDIKPDNIMIVEGAGGRMSIKVLDFGIAKMLDDDASRSLTQDGTSVGTPEYMAPEQAMGLPVDFRTDVYATGLVIYCMLSGNPPFTSANKMALLQRHIADKPRPIQTMSRSPIPDELATLVHSALAKDPADRPQSMEAFLTALDAVLPQLVEMAASSAGSPAAAPTMRNTGSKPAAARTGRKASKASQLALDLPTEKHFDIDGIGDAEREDFSLGDDIDFNDDPRPDVARKPTSRPAAKPDAKPDAKPAARAGSKARTTGPNGDKSGILVKADTEHLSTATESIRRQRKKTRTTGTTSGAFMLNEMLSSTSGHHAVMNNDDDFTDGDGEFFDDVRPGEYRAPRQGAISGVGLLFAGTFIAATVLGLMWFAWASATGRFSGELNLLEWLERDGPGEVANAIGEGSAAVPTELGASDEGSATAASEGSAAEQVTAEAGTLPPAQPAAAPDNGRAEPPADQSRPAVRLDQPATPPEPVAEPVPTPEPEPAPAPAPAPEPAPAPAPAPAAQRTATPEPARPAPSPRRGGTRPPPEL